MATKIPDSRTSPPPARPRPTMPDGSLLEFDGVDTDGFLRCPECGARLVATVTLTVRPVVRVGPDGPRAFPRNFASRRRIEREQLSRATECRCRRCRWAGALDDHPAAAVLAPDSDPADSDSEARGADQG
jgi:DNA-directed RNA polymerase subunit RPC12/RpoP